MASGFICPLCHLELESAPSLQDHFDTAHNEEATESRSSRKKRGLLSRFKKGKDPDVDGGGPGVGGGSGGGPAAVATVKWAPQGLGVSRKVSVRFKHLRSNRNQLPSEGHKLTNVLDCLIFDGPAKDGKPRKDYERSIVMWAPNDLVPLCITCGSKFGQMKRKHHCRLCGNILCLKCSLGLDCDTAIDLVRLTTENKRGKPYLKPPVYTTDFRICPMCHDSLQEANLHEIHLKTYLAQQAKGTPAVAKVAQSLEDIIVEVNDLLPYYLQLADALMDFQKLDCYKEAVGLRDSILKQCQEIGKYGKQLKAVQNKTAENKSLGGGACGFKVRAGLIKRCEEFVRSNMLGLPKLPTPEMIEEARKEQERLEEERIRRGEIPLPQGSDGGGGLFGKQSQGPKKALLGTLRMRITMFQPVGERASSLVVHVDSGTRLRIANEKTDSSDPYVQVYIPGGKDPSPKKTKTIKRTTDPVFDEDIVYPNIDPHEISENKLVVEVWSDGKAKRRIILGQAIVPIGLAVDHGKPIELILMPEGDTLEWSPFTPEEQLAMQIQLLDEMQQFSIMNTIANGMDWHDAMGLVQQFVGQQTLTKGRKADAQRAKQLLAGLHDLQRLDPVQRDAILSSVMKGMTMEEAMHLVRDFVRKASAANSRGAPRSKNPLVNRIPNKKRQEKLEAKKKRRLERMLATLDTVQAHPIYTAVESGDMAVTEALEFVKQFVSATGNYDSDDNDEVEAEIEAEAELEADFERLRVMLDKLDPVQAAPIYDAVEAGTMDIEEATALVAQFLGVEVGERPARSDRKPKPHSDAARRPVQREEPQNQGAQRPPNRRPSHRQPADEEVVTEASLARLVDALQVLDPAEAESIYNSVRDGVMPISEATRFVEEFVHRSGGASTINPVNETRQAPYHDNGGHGGDMVPRDLQRQQEEAPPPTQTGTLSLFASINLEQGLVVAIDTLCAEYAVVKPLVLGYLESNKSGSQKRAAAEGCGSTEIPLRQMVTFEEGRQQSIMEDTLVIEVWDFGGEPPFFIGNMQVGVPKALQVTDGTPYAVWKDPQYRPVLETVQPAASSDHVSQTENFEELYRDCVRVHLRRDEEYGYGLTLLGPRDDEERSGVFISRVKTPGPAADCGRIFVGMRILELNGVELVQGSKSDASRVFQQSGGSMEMVLAPPLPGSQWEEPTPDGPSVGRPDPYTSLAESGRTPSNDFNAYSNAPVRVVLERDAHLGYGITVLGPLDDAPRTGIFIKTVKPYSPAADSGRIHVGMRIIQMNGDDMTQACKSEAAQHLRGSDRVEIVFEPTPGWTPPVSEPVPQNQQTRPTSTNAQNRHAGPVMTGGNVGDHVRVVITRHPVHGFGLSLVGPSEDDPRTGIFISRVKEGPAAATGLITEGMRLLRMNGEDVFRATKAEAGIIFKGANEVELILQKAPTLDQVLTSPISSIGSPTADMPNPFAPRSAPKSATGDGGLAFGEASVEESSRVRLRKDPERGYGLGLVGPVGDEPRNGIYVSRVKPGPAADTGLITVGVQILAMNGINMRRSAKQDAARIFKGADMVDMVIGPRTAAGDAAISAQAVPASGPTRPPVQEPVAPVDLGGGRVRIVLDKVPGFGFGMSLMGPKHADPRTGIFVSGVKRGGPAIAASVQEGMKLIELNGDNVTKACKADVGEILRKNDRVTVVLERPPSLDDVLNSAEFDEFDLNLDVDSFSPEPDAVPGWSISEQLRSNSNAPDFDTTAEPHYTTPHDTVQNSSSVAPDWGASPEFGVATSPMFPTSSDGSRRDGSRRARGSVEYGEGSGGYSPEASFVDGGYPMFEGGDAAATNPEWAPHHQSGYSSEHRHGGLAQWQDQPPPQQRPPSQQVPQAPSAGNVLRFDPKTGQRLY